MGLQDRDYYREKHQGLNRPGNRSHMQYAAPGKRRSGNLRPLLTPALVLLGLWFGADKLLQHRVSQRPSPSGNAIPDAPANRGTTEPISGGLVIKADRYGHFRGTLLINDTPMPFMIDTGATMTSIPANLAYMAGLALGREIQTNTAGGTVTDRLTRIDRLQIGNAEIKNLDAAINQHLEEVLIGMNTLKFFTLTQSGDSMTLVANGSPPQDIIMPAPAVISQAEPQSDESPASSSETKRPTTIKRTVVCDANHVCTTKYSDH